MGWGVSILVDGSPVAYITRKSAPRKPTLPINSEESELLMRNVFVEVRIAGADTSSTIVSVSGILDVSTVEEFAETVRSHLRSGATVLVDLSGVTLCTSTGLGAVVRLERRARAIDCSFAIVNPRPHVAGILAMTGIDQVVSVRHTTGTSTPHTGQTSPDPTP
jgi:anti-sigma B factor antagonist